jgi:hypothetical protein
MVLQAKQLLIQSFVRNKENETSHYEMFRFFIYYTFQRILY